ncbi:MAG: hypothetical protein Q9201_003223 [Fulgogasparrea decipioides]
MALHQHHNTDLPPRQDQLLPNLIDEIARTDPERLYAETPASPTTYEDGWRKITYRDLANAINGVAWLLEGHLGHGTNHDTVAYIGPNDIAYVVMILGASKAGYTILSVSPRNTIADHISLLEATGCRYLLTPVDRSPTVTSILEKYPLRWKGMDPPEGYRSSFNLLRASRLLVTVPIFHAGGLLMSLFYAPFNRTIIVTPLSGAVPSAELIVDALKRVQVDLISLVPPFVETIASKPDMLEYVTKNVGTIFYGGAGISESAGNAFTSKTRFFNMNGSTETGLYPTIYPTNIWPSEDWNYIKPHPDAGIEFRAIGDGSGFSEAIIVKKPGCGNEQPVFALFPELTEYSTKDIFAPHPSKPGLWSHQRRTDDIIVFKAGYMCNPITMEHCISQHPEVQSVLMAGTGRFQPALLVEPAGHETLSTEAKSGLIDRLWPLISETNEKYSIGARVSKTHVVVLDSGQTMIYAGKVTVRRAPTLALYKGVLDDLYAREGDVAPGNDLALPVHG